MQWFLKFHSDSNIKCRGYTANNTRFFNILYLKRFSHCFLFRNIFLLFATIDETG